MQKISLKLCILIALISFASVPEKVHSQELDATVDVDVSAINIDIRDRLSNFKNDVQTI